MKSRLAKYTIALVIFFIVGYNSIYFRKVSELKAASLIKEFDAVTYAEQFWNKELTPRLSTAIDLRELIEQLENNSDKAFEKYSHALGIGNLRYFLLTGQGKVTSVNENDVSILIETDSIKRSVRLATEFVYGNAVRDAVGTIDLSDFSNTMYLNKVSAEINKKIRREVIPPFKAQVQKGMTVQFAGAIELNQKYVDLKNLQIIPVSINIVKR